MNDFCAFFTKQFAFCPFDLDAVARLCGFFVKFAIILRRKRAVQPVRVDIRADEVVLDDVIHPALVRLIVDLARDHKVKRSLDKGRFPRNGLVGHCGDLVVDAVGVGGFGAFEVGVQREREEFVFDVSLAAPSAAGVVLVEVQPFEQRLFAAVLDLVEVPIVVPSRHDLAVEGVFAVEHAYAVARKDDDTSAFLFAARELFAPEHRLDTQRNSRDAGAQVEFFVVIFCIDLSCGDVVGERERVLCRCHEDVDIGAVLHRRAEQTQREIAVSLIARLSGDDAEEDEHRIQRHARIEAIDQTAQLRDGVDAVEGETRDRLVDGKEQRRRAVLDVVALLEHIDRQLYAKTERDRDAHDDDLDKELCAGHLATEREISAHRRTVCRGERNYADQNSQKRHTFSLTAAPFCASFSFFDPSGLTRPRAIFSLRTALSMSSCVLNFLSITLKPLTSNIHSKSSRI